MLVVFVQTCLHPHFVPFDFLLRGLAFAPVLAAYDKLVFLKLTCDQHFGKMSQSARIKQSRCWTDCLSQTVLASTNSRHYSWPYSRGHCHGVYLSFFFSSVNWKSRENELRYPCLEWAIGLTLTRPQTANWRNSFINVMWTLGWWELWVKYWNLRAFI